MPEIYDTPEKARVNSDLVSAELFARQAIKSLERAIAAMPKGERWGYARVAATRLRGVKEHFIDPIQPGHGDAPLHKLDTKAKEEIEELKQLLLPNQMS